MAASQNRKTRSSCCRLSGMHRADKNLDIRLRYKTPQLQKKINCTTP